MTMFDDREKAFEAKYRMDEEQTFKVTVRRDRLLGQWAAARLGLKADEAEAYAKSVVEADMAEPGDEDVIRKVMKDFADRKAELSEAELRSQLQRLMGEAREQVLGELGK